MEKEDFLNSKELIAPCGMNCAICSGYLALKHDVNKRGVRMPYCKGCRVRDKKCAFLKKKCPLLLHNKIRFCYECQVFPCERLRNLDKRYRTHFQMSMIENLKTIKKEGLSEFLEKERKKWQCPKCKGVICCHNGICFNCQLVKLKKKKKRLAFSGLATNLKNPNANVWHQPPNQNSPPPTQASCADRYLCPR